MDDAQMDIRKSTPKVLCSVGDPGRDRKFASLCALAGPSAVAGVRQLADLTFATALLGCSILVKFILLEAHATLRR